MNMYECIYFNFYKFHSITSVLVHKNPCRERWRRLDFEWFKSFHLVWAQRGCGARSGRHRQKREESGLWDIYVFGRHRLAGLRKGKIVKENWEIEFGHLRAFLQ